MMIMISVTQDSLEHPGGLAAELVPDRALQQTLHQAAEDVGEWDLVTTHGNDQMMVTSSS